MKDFFIKLFMDLNTFLLRISRGRVGSRLGTQTILLLETIGRKSGKPREIPIAYFFHEGKYLIVESNWGRDNHADWYLNLSRNPRAKLTVNGRMIPVEARDALLDEHTQLWDYVTKKHPPYLDYQKMTSRRIPIVVFESIS
ncbi:MAG: nitroreductase family deazaflavin-dependent oxidoreductase [Chloroflexi bacterium]|nr:nitroreductase family deazaflavin-dependent oxidoreductase [Chloroflexota bacterium]